VHITNLWLLVPEMGVYGVAALMVREVVRSKRCGWGTILILGIAYALIEECVILQTSLTPQFFASGTSSFGWALGVQWSYLVSMLGYESVYAIMMPIYLTEMIFPQRRAEPWLGRRGLLIAAGIFLVAGVGVWLLWENVGLKRYGPSTYQVPLLNILLALVVIVLLIALALALPSSTRQAREPGKRRAWSPWLLAPIAFVFALIWWLLIAFAYVPASTFNNASPLVPIGFGLVWGLLSLLVIRALSRGRGWQDRHRLALIIGAQLASMLGGVLVILATSPVDRLGKLILDLVALSLLFYLAWRLRKRRQAAPVEERSAESQASV
jgi:hypothetical protein